MRFDVDFRSRCCVLTLVGIVFALIVAAPGFAQDEVRPASEFTVEQLDFFEREVRPLLVKRCYECHGDVGDELKGGLRVDSRPALLKGGDTGAAIDVEHPAKSLLLDAIRYGEMYQMPPKSKLPANELAVLEKWILAKAPWPAEAVSSGATTKKFDLEARKASHWAWKLIVRPSVPAVVDAAWPKSDIDRFILAKLEAVKLHPSKDADKRVLIRRLYYDLLGLPPPPERVAEFLKDDRLDAIERLVDELLKSPQFGERWARHWLDVVAYAETRGHEFDYDIPGVQHYRDYVVRAINDDMPFDQFAMEHIAGDLIDRRDAKNAHDSALATGFWHLGEWLHSPVDIRKDERDRFDRMIDVYSKSFLGLTVSCARCHDHKFDAISQVDYYALSGFLQSMEYRQYRFESNGLERQAATELEQASSALQAKLREYLSKSLKPAIEGAEQYATAALGSEGTGESASLDAARLRAWKKELDGAKFTAAEAPALKEPIADARVIESFSEPARELLQDGFAFGHRAAPAGQVLLSDDPAHSVIGIRENGAAVFDRAFSRLATAAKTQRDMGALGATIRSGKTLRTNTFVLNGSVLHYLVRGAGRAIADVDSHRAVNGPLHGGLVNAFDSGKENAWRWVRHDLKGYVGHNLHVEFSPDKEGPFEVALVVEASQPPFELVESSPLWKRLPPAEFRRAALELVDSWSQSGSGAGLSREQAHDLDTIVKRPDLFPPVASIEGELRSQIDTYFQLQSLWMERLAAPTHLAVSSWEGSPVDDDLLVRGNAHIRGDVVPRAFLTSLRSETKSAETGASRLDLAKSTVSPGNPLFARVAVNRVWHYLFGRGIVPTVDNFGVLGLPPSHPELLDHLAGEFASDGYSLKRLIKRIVLSRTYQQASGHHAEADAIDPSNQLLHRMNLRRRDAEGIRDSILAISGRLDLQPLVGESVPVHLTPYMEGRGRPVTSGPLDGDGKRSIYLALRRNFLPPFLLVFDFPVPAAPFGARNKSNVPAQALALLNDPFMHDQARVWAATILAEEGSFEARLGRAYQRGLSREPTADEIAGWKEFIAGQAEEMKISAGDAETDQRIWVDICHLLFNSKEFLFVE
jgi:hypothetical protein